MCTDAGVSEHSIQLMNATAHRLWHQQAECTLPTGAMLYLSSGIIIEISICASA